MKSEWHEIRIRWDWTVTYKMRQNQNQHEIRTRWDWTLTLWNEMKSQFHEIEMRKWINNLILFKWDLIKVNFNVIENNYEKYIL